MLTDCSLDFLAIASELRRLHEVFKNVLPGLVWEKGLALLVDHTVNEMVTKVLSWDDISASVANELAASFIKFAVETSHLFKGEATSVREIDALTSKAVEKWQRFSMSEIGDNIYQNTNIFVRKTLRVQTALTDPSKRIRLKEGNCSKIRTNFKKKI